MLGHRTAAMVQHDLRKMNRLHNALNATGKRAGERRRVAEAKAKAQAQGQDEGG